MSLVSAGCLVWLEALKPVFAVTAVSAMAWQAWLVWRRPAARRTVMMWALVMSTVGVNLFVGLSWLALQWRYR